MMELTITEENGKMLVSTEERNHTIMTMLRQAVWDDGGKAGYKKGHPYAGESTLVVEDDDPEEALRSAVDTVRDQLAAFEDAFESA